MQRTDLAWEAALSGGRTEGVERREEEGVRVMKLEIRTREEAEALQKPCGRYITVEVPELSRVDGETAKQAGVIAKELASLLTGEGSVLVVGLGNLQITPDALGPQTAGEILVTRHIAAEAGMEGFRPVAAISPGVLGQTGIEVSEIVRGIVERTGVSLVIAVDALAAGSVTRLGKTIQISDTGISPGSGVANARKALDRENLGVEVIAIGVPTVVDGGVLASEMTEGGVARADCPRMMVTPRDIDLIIRHSSHLLATAINLALHPYLSPEDIAYLCS